MRTEATRERRKKKRNILKEVKAKMKSYRKMNIRAEHRYEMDLYSKLQECFGFQMVRQYQVGFYFIDILMLDRLLAIEVDGSSHDKAPQKAKDLKKTALIEKFGFNVLRIKNSEVADFEPIRDRIVNEFPVVIDHSIKFKAIHARVTGHYGYCLSAMSKSRAGYKTRRWK